MTLQEDQKFIFISYAHKDSQIVLPLIQGLKDRGFHIWYDERIEAGSEWPEYIATNLLASECVIFLMSPNADASHNCRQELTYAINKRKNIVVVYLEDFQPSPGTEMQLHNLHALYRSHFADDDSLLDRLANEPKLSPCLYSIVLPSVEKEAPRAPQKASHVAPTYNDTQPNDSNNSGATTKNESPVSSTPNAGHRKNKIFLFLLICILQLPYGYIGGIIFALFESNFYWSLITLCIANFVIFYIPYRVVRSFEKKLPYNDYIRLSKFHFYCYLLAQIFAALFGSLWVKITDGYFYNLLYCAAFTLLSCMISLSSLKAYKKH